MKKRFTTLGTIATLIALAFAVGCDSSRNVKVSGTIAGDVGEGGPIRLEFYEPSSTGDAGAAAPTGFKLVDSVSVEAAGHFDATVPLEGNALYVVAVVDKDKSDACNDGESWGEALANVAADDTAAVTLSIAPQSKCPTLGAK